METTDKFDKLIEKAENLIERFFAKIDSKPKYILGHTLADKNKIESLEERIKAWGFQKTESEVWISNVLNDKMETKDLITILKRTKKFVLANEGNIILVINEKNKRKKNII